MRVLESGSVRHAGRKSRRTTARVAFVAGVSTLLAGIAGLGGFAQAGSSSEPRVALLLAGIDAAEDEAVLAAVFGEVVREGVGGAFRFVSAERLLPDDLHAPEPSAPLAIDEARRLALLGGVSAVITGSVEARGPGNAFILRAIDPESGDLLVAVRETSPGRADAMSAMSSAEARFERWLHEAFRR
jgi:hypothetical protein